MLIDQFEKEQNKIRENIKCEICNKMNINNEIFYRCIKCEKNICSVCKSKHYNNHKIIN